MLVMLYVACRLLATAAGFVMSNMNGFVVLCRSLMDVLSRGGRELVLVSCADCITVRVCGGSWFIRSCALICMREHSCVCAVVGVVLSTRTRNDFANRGCPSVRLTTKLLL
jgi:hypothetical protein